MTADRSAPVARLALTRLDAAPTQRLSKATRREAILESAREVFADLGFSASTRELARAMGVTQALIYKHFPSKAALVEAVIGRAVENARQKRASAPVPVAFADRTVPLRDRLVHFYASYRGDDRGIGQRLFVRAGLEGLSLPAQHGAALTAAVFEPIIAELRHEAQRPDLCTEPMTRGERELAMMLHGAVMFLGIREHVYRMPMPEDRAAIIGLYVDVFLDGARAVLPSMSEAAGSLAVRQLAPRRKG